MVGVLVTIATVVPIAMTLLFNGSDAWGNTPSYIITLLTTVVAVFFALGIFLHMMPAEVKSRVGLFYIPDISLQYITDTPRYNASEITALGNFESIG